jgi:Saccharopine dehydrogenase NADP binding domain
MLESHTVAVYGATGHTGRFVVEELERRGVAVLRIARRAPMESIASQDGSRPAWMSASCDEPDALDRALAGTDAVINCAGPFLDTAPAVVESALRLGVHYFDIAAEQRSVRQTLATYSDEARDRDVVLLPAMAFYGGLADLLATQLCAGLRTVDEIFIAVALDYWHPTAGTRHTGERNTARRLVVSGGHLAPLPASSPAAARWRYPPPFGDQPVAGVPLSEIITISRHIAARRIESFMNEAPLRDLGRADTPPPTPAEASGRSSQRFVMDVAVSGDGVWKRMATYGHDIYAVTAPLVVEACMRVLCQSPAKGGAFAPGELFDPQDFLAALSPDIRVVESIRPNAIHGRHPMTSPLQTGPELNQ